MKTTCLTLPWFPPELSPNKRIYWRKKNPIKAAYRDECYFIAKQCAYRCVCGVNIGVKIIFHPPRRGMDLDNCLASFKAGIDGLSKGLGINDKNLRPITIDFGEPIKGGMIVVEFNQ